MNDPDSTSAEVAPALALWTQLATRITTQPLHYRSGEEETAAVSVYALFPKVRELLEKHPDATEFREVAVSLLNDTLRPYTARWHGWMTEVKNRTEADGKPTLRFNDERVRRMFRKELGDLRPRLQKVKLKLAEMAEIEDFSNGDNLPSAVLGDSLRAGIQQQVSINLEAKGKGTLATADEINAAEIKEILNRRFTLGTLQQGDSPRSEEELNSPQNKDASTSGEYELNNAIGLALSGGGIRSATFCLGIVQTLVRKGLLPQFDYLSTVSGGGYLGGFMSSSLGTQLSGTKAENTKESAEARIKAVFNRQEKNSKGRGVESGLLRHLRNSSKYLLGGGFRGKMTIVGLLLSGVLWNVMMILPIPLGAALLASFASPVLWGWANFPVFPSITSPIGIALIVFGGGLALGWITLPGIQMVTHGKPPRSKGARFRNIWELGTLILGVLTVTVGVIYLIPTLFHGYDWLRTSLAKLSLGGLEESAEFLPASVTGAAGAVLAVFAKALGSSWTRLRLLTVKLFILSGPLLFLLIFLMVGNRLGLAREESAPWTWQWVLGISASLGVWGWLFVNINTLAPHRYYRNRICECYLVRRIQKLVDKSEEREQRFTGERIQKSVKGLKQVPLSSLGADRTAPYHLINMTVNVPSSDNKNLRGRASDFFLASRHFYGSPLTGYGKIEDLEKVDPHFDLGTAVAVSGAAASSSMGFKTMPHFRFMMTLFNVRLGYWLTNPGRPARHWLFQGAGPLYLFREMLGFMNENCRYLNLSDGGHIENLAAYELLRRRCKFIVCVDGGHEPGMECTDLVRLQRYAEIDLGVRMFFDPADLQIGENGLSRAHAILVKIDYGPAPATHLSEEQTSNQLGWMLYIKLAMTGVESTYVKDYKRVHPEFPHQTTGDQIFEEDQFEAYRDLGECAMEGLFRKELVGEQSPANVHEWFEHLADNLLPDNDPAFSSSESDKESNPR